MLDLVRSYLRANTMQLQATHVHIRHTDTDIYKFAEIYKSFDNSRISTMHIIGNTPSLTFTSYEASYVLTETL